MHKSSTILFSLIFYTAGFAQQSTPYHVARIDPASARFQNLLSAVQAAEAQKLATLRPLAIETIQNIDDGLYLAFLRPGGFSREAGALTGRTADPDIVAVQRKAGAPIAVDGESLALLLVPAGTHEYIAVTGAKKTVHRYIELDPDKTLTAAEFLTRLQAGESWTITTQSPGQRPQKLRVLW